MKSNRGVLDLILFLAAINLIASMYHAAFPVSVLSRWGGGEAALGIVQTAADERQYGCIAAQLYSA